MSHKMPREVYLVGAGPGDPGLLTLRGLELLQQADAVVYDHLASPKLLDLAAKATLKICAGKSVGHCTMAQSEINDTLVRLAREGRVVVRLKGGDPYLFGRGGEEAERLSAEGIPFEVVPGVTSALGAAAYAGIPLTHRADASAVAFVTGHENSESSTAPRLDWENLARFPGTLVVYMGVTHLENHCRTLIRFGKPADTPSALVASGTLPHQRAVVGTLANLAERVRLADVGAPALWIVGDVVTRRPALNWFESRPLFGQRILVTRPAVDDDASSSALEALGAEVIQGPCLTIQPPADFEAVDSAIGRLSEFDWLVFTSANGVRGFLNRLEARGLDMRALGTVKLAAIGASTAESLQAFRLRADLVPDEFRSEGLADRLAELARGKRILLARGSRGRTHLADALSPIAHVESLVVYENADAEALPEPAIERLREGSIDWITVTSPATAQRLNTLLPEEARGSIGNAINLATISPQTTEAAARLGWNVAAEAEVATWQGVVEAILKVTRIPSSSRADDPA